jgi:hypothetical protein
MASFVKIFLVTLVSESAPTEPEKFTVPPDCGILVELVAEIVGAAGFRLTKNPFPQETTSLS